MAVFLNRGLKISFFWSVLRKDQRELASLVQLTGRFQTATVVFHNSARQ
jgi:hypothetical protein